VFLTIYVDHDLRSDMSISMPRAYCRRWIVVKGERSIEVLCDLGKINDVYTLVYSGVPLETPLFAHKRHHTKRSASFSRTIRSLTSILEARTTRLLVELQ